MKATKGNMKKLQGKNPIMFCPQCYEEYAASPGDYFLVLDSYVFSCDYCKCELVLGYKTQTYVVY